MNPLLDPLRLPSFPELTPEAIRVALDEALADHRAVIAELTTQRPTDFARAWLPYERAEARVDALWSAVSHLCAVANTPELRAVETAGKALIAGNDLAVAQNRDFYDVLQALTDSLETADLRAEDRVAVERAIRAFTLSGAALPLEARDRLRSVSMELARLENEFGNAVLDATEAWFEHIDDPTVLAGIPPTDMTMFAVAARKRGLDGWLVSLQYPSVAAVLQFAENRGLRARVYEAFGTVASDKGPHAGLFDNSERMMRIVALRRELADLLGFADPVALSLQNKMATNGDDVLSFLRDLARRARTSAENEADELRTFAAETLGIHDLQLWDRGYAAARLRQTRYALDEEAARRYFPLSRVVTGWRTLLHRLFGISLIGREDVALYHEDVRYYDIADENGEVIAGLYVDLHSRAGKRSGAWMSQARPRLRDGKSSRVPVAYLVCNFAPCTGDAPSLLNHADIVTLLHETGHALHHLFTRIDRPSIAGTTGFEWDAIELPSQLFEDFAWEESVLAGMSGHVDTGEPLPPELFDRMLEARGFLSGQTVLRQIEFAMFDLVLHLDRTGSDPMAILEAVRDEVAVVRPPEWHRFPHSFTHIFAGSYASGYYSYLWAEVLAADGFRRFEEAGLIDRATGDSFRDEILSRGASRPAGDSFRAFRGRDADPQAMLARRGLLTQEADA